MSLNELLIYSEQMTKPLITTSSATMSIGSATNKPFSASERQSDSAKCFSNSLHQTPLGKYQGRSWSEVLDFDRILKQIRLSEKSLVNDKEYNGSCHGHSSSNSYKATSGNLSLHDKPRKPQIRQVQRLSGMDMHYYGIVPKQTAIDVIVCNLCTGTYTKKGFNNHMLQQHPTVWASISNKVLLTSSEKGPVTSDICQDGGKDDTVGTNNTDVISSPSDLSGMLSNSSNASSSSTSTASSALTYIPGSGFNSRQKTTSNTASESSRKISGSRSRSKSKHHNSSTKANVDESNSGYTTTSSSKKASKKHSSSSSSSSCKNTNRNSVNTPSLIANNKDLSGTKDPNVTDKLLLSNKKQMEVIRPAKNSTSSSYSTSSTSSNPSYSLPATPKILLTNVQDKTTVNQVSSLSSITEYPYSPLEGNSKSSNNANETESSTPKKKNKLALNFIGHDNAKDASNGKKSKLTTSVTANNGISKSQHFENPSYKMQSKSVEKSAAPFITEEKIKDSNGSNQIEFTLLNTNQESQQSSVLNGDGQILQNASDDSAMLKHVLEEFNRLDSKVINEILNAEAELNFNPNDINHDITNSNSNCSNNLMQQQSAIYLDQPANKRMRFDDTCSLQQQITQITPTATSQDGSIAFTIYQPQSQYRNQQYIQYSDNNSDVVNTIQLDPQYHTTIDSLQMQNLLYQQQQQQQQQQQKQQLQNQIDSNVAYGNMAIDDVNMLNVEQMPDVIMAPKTILRTDHADQLLTKFKQDGYNHLPDGNTQQYQIFNVPSLTEDIENQTMAHIVEGQYVLPENDEEQFIYEISTTNSVAAMSQEHQQEVIAEFLNQAATSYEQNQMEKSLQYMQYNSAENLDLISNELLDFDFSLVDTIQSTSNIGNRNIPVFAINNNINNNLLIKDENDQQNMSSNKNKDDCYYNVLFYAGIPRPLSINSFGMVNLPQAIATTFHKYLINTRKVNNSLLSLGSISLNGMIQQNSSITSTSALTHRFSATKQLPNYFTALAAVNNGRITAQGNEFSIGSITITNASHANVNHQHGPNSAVYQQSKQHLSNIDIACNWTNGVNNTAMSSVTAVSRMRNKIGVTNANNNCSAFVNMGSSNFRSKYFSGLGASVNPTQVTVRPIGPNNTNTIMVNNAGSSSMNRNNKVIKRGIFNKIGHISRPQPTTNAQFTSKQLANLLNRKLVMCTKSTSNISNTELQMQTKASRINHFYEHRRKVLNMSRPTNNRSITKTAKSLPLTFSHQTQKLLKQQLTHNFPNYSKISGSTIAEVLSSDVMQVLV